MKGEVKKEMEMFTNRIKLFCSGKRETNMKILRKDLARWYIRHWSYGELNVDKSNVQSILTIHL